MPVINLQRRIKAHADLVWRVISDLAAFAEVTPHISKVEMLDGEKATARRRLYSHSGYSWTERCVMWDEGKAYTMEVESSDSAYPFKKMQRSFALEEQPHGVVLRMRFEYKTKYGLFGQIRDRLFLRRKRQALYEELLNNWIARIRDQEWSYSVTVATVLDSKGHDIVMAAEDDSIIEVARILRKNRIGALLIHDKEGQLVGLASERDIASALADHGPTALDFPISDVMAKELVVCEPHNDLDFVLACMTDQRIRHLPVMQEGELVGIISIGDVVKARIYSLETESETMREYIAGRAWQYHSKHTGVHDVTALRQDVGGR